MKYLSNYNESTNTFIGKDIDLQFIKDSLSETLDNNKYKAKFLFYTGKYIGADDFKGIYYFTYDSVVNDILNDSIDKYRNLRIISDFTNKYKNGLYLYGLELEIDIILENEIPRKLEDISHVKDNMIKVANILEDIETFLNRSDSNKYKVSYYQNIVKEKFKGIYSTITLFIFDKNAKDLIDAQESTFMRNYDSDKIWIEF